MKSVLAALGAAALLSCGAPLPGNSQYAGTWNGFVANNLVVSSAFTIDDHGRFEFSAPGANIAGSISPDGKVSGSAYVPGAGGACALVGTCSSANACTGTTQGPSCPVDASGSPWLTFGMCRGSSC